MKVLCWVIDAGKRVEFESDEDHCPGCLAEHDCGLGADLHYCCCLHAAEYDHKNP